MSNNIGVVNPGDIVYLEHSLESGLGSFRYTKNTSSGIVLVSDSCIYATVNGKVLLDFHPNPPPLLTKLPNSELFNCDLPNIANAGFEQPKEGCQHQWVEVGFNFTKTVCKLCDKEQEQND